MNTDKFKNNFNETTAHLFDDEEIMTILFDRMRKLRRSCCMSQNELAAASGVSPTTIKRIESGKMKDVNLMTMIKLVRATGGIEGCASFIPDSPESPFLMDPETGHTRKYCTRRLVTGNEKERKWRSK